MSTQRFFAEIPLRLGSWFLLALVVAWGLLPDRATAVVRERAGGNELSQLDGQPLRKVFDWLVDQTGVPLVCSFCPTGTFTYRGPKHAQLSIPEAIDIINDSLSQLGSDFLLIRSDDRFTFIPIDEPILFSPR